MEASWKRRYSALLETRSIMHPLGATQLFHHRGAGVALLVQTVTDVNLYFVSYNAIYTKRYILGHPPTVTSNSVSRGSCSLFNHIVHGSGSTCSIDKQDIT